MPCTVPGCSIVGKRHVRPSRSNTPADQVPGPDVDRARWSRQLVASVRSLAGEPVGQEVGQQHEAGRRRSLAPRAGRRAGGRASEREELQAVDGEELRSVDTCACDVVDDVGGAVVAVGDGLGQQPALGVEQPVVRRAQVSMPIDSTSGCPARAGSSPSDAPVRTAR